MQQISKPISISERVQKPDRRAFLRAALLGSAVLAAGAVTLTPTRSHALQGANGGSYTPPQSSESNLTPFMRFLQSPGLIGGLMALGALIGSSLIASIPHVASIGSKPID